MIYDEDVVPDGEWRSVREGFSNAGIPLSNRPSVILFYLCKRTEAAALILTTSPSSNFLHSVCLKTNGATL
jgi:hypothetical protein